MLALLQMLGEGWLLLCMFRCGVRALQASVPASCSISGCCMQCCVSTQCVVATGARYAFVYRVLYNLVDATQLSFMRGGANIRAKRLAELCLLRHTFPS